jgi:beta-galactosidase
MARPAVPVIPNPPVVVLGWIRSRITERPLDPNQQPAATDMNSWDNVHLGSDLPAFDGGRFAVYRAQFAPRAATQKSGGRLVLRDVVGKAQVWVDGKLAGEKVDPEKQDMTVAFPGRDGERVVRVLIEAPAAGKPAGLGGIVTVE